MRLYTTTGATQFDDPEHGTFKADENGAFNGLPDAMYEKLHGFPGWENDAERELRITKEELDRFRDPAELLKAVKELGANQGVLASAIATALGLTQQPPAVSESPAPAQNADLGAVSGTSDPADEVPQDDGEPAMELTESPTSKPEPTDSIKASAPVKTTSGRGRGSKAAKSAASDAS